MYLVCICVCKRRQTPYIISIVSYAYADLSSASGDIVPITRCWQTVAATVIRYLALCELGLGLMANSPSQKPIYS